MKYNKLSLYFACLLLVLGTSCKKFLEQKNPNELPVTEFYQTLADCNTGLNSVYASLYESKSAGGCR